MTTNAVAKTNELDNARAIRGSGIHTSNVQMYASRDLRYIYHRVPGGRTISQHVNYYKRILDVPFSSEQRNVIPLPFEDRPKPFVGYTGNVKVRKSQDGEYLTHFWGEGERITLPTKLYMDLITHIDAQVVKTQGAQISDADRAAKTKRQVNK